MGLLIGDKAFSQEKRCFSPRVLHSTLLDMGMLPFAYGMTDRRYLIKLYVGKVGYVLILQDEKTACIAEGGKTLYTPKRRSI